MSVSLEKKKSCFSTCLLEWYLANKRDLPWRRSRNPYYIWISEVMLQQTRVETVIPYFHRFIEKFPTIEALSSAPEEEVLKAWEGLGYYSRARNLQSAVREVNERYEGIVPQEKEEISSLKGVGPYTAGAVLSIAYNKPEPAVDGNVMRVLSRYFLIEDDISKGSTRIAMEKLARQLIPEGSASDFNQALMELGALVCTPRSPHCLTCPVMEHCSARLEGMELSLPVKKKAKPPRPEHRAVALIEGAGEHAGKLLIRQRPQEGLLAKMWELPHVEVEAERMLPSEERVQDIGGPQRAEVKMRSEAPAADGAEADLMRLLLERDGVRVSLKGWMMDAEHTFSHIHWNLKVYRCALAEERGVINGSGFIPYHYRWIRPEEMESYAFPNVFIRILRAYMQF